MKTLSFLLAIASFALTSASLATAQNQTTPNPTTPGRTIARLFWQDDSQATLRWGDLKKSSTGWSLQPQSTPGFPSLDQAEQSLAQMQTDASLVLVGVHDHADGSLGSGWVAIESGVVEEPHGDHSHWRFTQSPKLLRSQIDTEQGNPAHVYRYGASFVLANDKKNGFTVTSAARLRSAPASTSASTFYSGGNGHITLAMVDDRVAYATWIAAEGEDCGRVDVVGVGSNHGKGYSIACPSGRLHGATANSGKVFFAPADGVCWVEADRDLNMAPESVSIHHLSLGTDQNAAPLRTGAFNNFGSWVLFTAGKGEAAKLCLLDAAHRSPTVNELPIELDAGETLARPMAFRTRGGKSLAVMFRENRQTPENDTLLVVDLDPNADGKATDLALAKSIAIGRNQIAGHGGHHAAAVLPGGRELVISNPADASLSVISLGDLSVVATIPVEGTPTRLVAIGG